MRGICNAQDLVDNLNKIAKLHGVELKDIEVNMRVDFDSDVHAVNWVSEDTFDPETNEKLVGVVLFNDDSGNEEN